MDDSGDEREKPVDEEDGSGRWWCDSSLSFLPVSAPVKERSRGEVDSLDRVDVVGSDAVAEKTQEREPSGPSHECHAAYNRKQSIDSRARSRSPLLPRNFHLTLKLPDTNGTLVMSCMVSLTRKLECLLCIIVFQMPACGAMSLLAISR